MISVMDMINAAVEVTVDGMPDVLLTRFTASVEKSANGQTRCTYYCTLRIQSSNSSV